MKTLPALEYVNRAVSTDVSRYNLNAAWRQDTRLCATDGHRVHLVSNLAIVHQITYVDGRDCTPPDVDRVMGELPSRLFDWNPTKSQLQVLRALCRIAPLKRAYGVVAILEVTSSAVTLRSPHDACLQWSLQLEGVDIEDRTTPLRIGVTLPYLLDAVTDMGHCSVRHDPADTSGRNLKRLGNIEISYHISNLSDYRAIICPVRLDPEDVVR